MILNLFIFLVVIGAVYIFVHHNSNLAATTSAIGEIWSGGCRLSCRHSEYSGFSGLSGLIPRNSQDNKSYYVARASFQEPSSCVCASCPCALIENVLRTCRPATTMYSLAVQLVASVYYTVIESLSEMYKYMERALNCHVSCQRPKSLENNDLASETMYFGNNGRKESIEKGKDKSRKLESAMRPSKSIVFRDISDTITTIQDDNSSKNATTNYSIKIGVSDATLKPEGNDEGSKSMVSEAGHSCPKCIKQGKVCMQHCPNAMNKKK